ncbi:hypothetical protein Avbf_05143 [Armadillidium vulgare]|nr:hypothetical protein Avbf_05143 [Armadillidium vulgare]
MKYVSKTNNNLCFIKVVIVHPLIDVRRRAFVSSSWPYILSYKSYTCIGSGEVTVDLFKRWSFGLSFACFGPVQL